MDLLQKAGSQLKILPHTVINDKEEEVSSSEDLNVSQNVSQNLNQISIISGILSSDNGASDTEIV